MYHERRPLIRRIESLRESRVLLYVTGDRPGLSTQIHPEVLDLFVDHLDQITGKRSIDKLSLILYTRGGHTIAAWSLVNLLRQFTHTLEVIVPYKAHSAGTIVCLGADNIVMTKQAQLSPIDPSHNGPLNPPIPGHPQQGTVPVSVEAINGYVNLARQDLGLKPGPELAQVLAALAEKVHPLVLGETYRARSQIRMLARRLLSERVTDEEQIDRVVSFLTADSGSHDYTINRREAKEDLGLPIEKPDDQLYDCLRQLYLDVREELQLNEPYNPHELFGTSDEVPYRLVQALIESGDYGSHTFIREGVMRRLSGRDQNGLSQVLINDQPQFQGWKHDPDSGQ
jgi:hypothetical protein